MPSTADLEAAGSRAAAQPVSVPPPVAELQVRAGKQQAKRRLVGSGVVALAFLGLAIPAALNMRSESVVQEVATAGAAEIAPAGQTQDPANGDGDSPVAATVQDDPGESQDHEANARFEVRLGDDINFEVRVLSGDQAASAAAAAEIAADETRVVDGQTVWITRDSDQSVVSTLIRPDEFIEVTGPTDQLDRMLEVAANGGPDLPPFPNMPEFERFFEDFEGFEGFQGFEDFEGDEFFNHLEERFGEGFNFEFDLDHEGGEHPRFEFNFGQPGERGEFDLFFEGELGDAFADGDFSKLEDFFEGLERDFPDFREQFERGDFGGHSFFNAENFDGCVSISTDRDGESMTFEFPEGCTSDS